MKYLRIVLGMSILVLIGSIFFQQDWIQNDEGQYGNPDTLATLQLKVVGMT